MSGFVQTFKILLEVQARVIIQENEIKATHIGEVKLSTCRRHYFIQTTLKYPVLPKYPVSYRKFSTITEQKN